MEQIVRDIEKQIPRESYGEYWLKHKHWIEGEITEERFHLYHIQLQDKYDIEFDFKLCPICVNNTRVRSKGETYSRLKYFKTNLERMQGIENLDISVAKIEAIKREEGSIYERIKKLGYTNLYGHQTKIASMIYGFRIPRLPHFIKNNLIHMFMEVEESFMRMNNIIIIYQITPI